MKTTVLLLITTFALALANTTDAKIKRTPSSAAEFEYIYENMYDNYSAYGNPPCGLSGTINERMKDCSQFAGTDKDDFFLITRTKGNKEIYRQFSNRIIWSYKLPSAYDFHGASNACASLKNVAGIKNLAWRLPNQDDYLKAQRSGLLQKIPDMKAWFWTSSIHLAHWGWQLDGFNGGFENFELASRASVRCVANAPY